MSNETKLAKQIANKVCQRGSYTQMLVIPEPAGGFQLFSGNLVSTLATDIIESGMRRYMEDKGLR